MSKFLDQPDILHKIELNLPAVAVTLEALDDLLVERGILEPGELMRRAERLARTKVLPGGDG